MPTAVGFDPSTYNSSSPGGFTLGAVYDWTGKLYVFVKAGSALALGDVCCWTTNFGSEAAQSKTAPAIDYALAGGASGVVTLANYGFLQVGGEHVAVKDAANACVAGAKLTIHTVTPGNAVVVSGATQALLG